MQPEIASFLFGCTGAAFNELLHWGALKRRKTFPTYARSPVYWLITILLILAGGVVTYAVATSVPVANTHLVNLITGFSAPALVQKLSRFLVKNATLGTAEAEPRPTWKTFLAG